MPASHQRANLSDGREILFFQDHDSPAPLIAVDPRPNDSRPDSGTLRFDVLTGEWVAVATHRQTRTHLPAAAECPLCPSTPDRPKQPLFHILLAILDDDATIATVHLLARDVIDAVVILLDYSGRNLLNAC